MINLIFWALSWGAVLQSIISLLQFLKQSSIGLHFFGESILKLGEPGVANISIDGAKILRGYGTFLHPNILAAFLVIGLISLCYLALQNYKLITNSIKLGGYFKMVILFSALFIVLLGLILTFSRSAWLVAIISLGMFLFFSFYNTPSKHSAIYLFLTLSAIIYTITIILSPFIFSRISFNLDEPAIADRLAYNKLGLEIIRQHPFFGVGLGHQVQYAMQNNLYEKFSLTKPWQKQSVHNLYILMADEIGVCGLLIFLIFVAWLLVSRIRLYFKIKKLKLEIITSLVMLYALLSLGLFDHYLWDIWQGQLLLTLVIGIVMGVGIRPRSSTDRILPSEGSDAGSIPAEDTK